MAGKRLQYPIDALELSTRARNALVRAGLTTPEDLVALSDLELLALRGFGPASLEELQERLAAWKPEIQPIEDAPAEGSGEEDEPADEVEYEPLTLLPGRRVLHATWFPGSPGTLFLWGEGQPRSPAAPTPQSETSNRSTERSRQSLHSPFSTHPFHLPPDALRDALPGLVPDAAAEAVALARLPTTDQGPEPSPHLIRELLGEEPSEPESLDTWQVAGLALTPLAALAFPERSSAPGGGSAARGIGRRPALLVAGGQIRARAAGPAAVCPLAGPPGWDVPRAVGARPRRAQGPAAGRAPGRGDAHGLPGSVPSPARRRAIGPTCPTELAQGLYGHDGGYGGAIVGPAGASGRDDAG